MSDPNQPGHDSEPSAARAENQGSRSGQPPTRTTRTAVYVISVAAELAGMHPQTLRIYERRGLVSPARTQGGNRRYSDEDIERLRRISELTTAGMNLEGIRRVMRLEAENARAVAVGDRERVRELSDRAVEARLAEVTEEADSIANEIVGEARREELRISSRLDHLRAAITEVEIKIHDLAALATPYTEQIAEIIDLTAIEEDQPLTGSGRS